MTTQQQLLQTLAGEMLIFLFFNDVKRNDNTAPTTIDSHPTNILELDQPSISFKKLGLRYLNDVKSQ